MADIIQNNDLGKCGATITLPVPTIINSVGEVTTTTNLGVDPGTDFFFLKGAVEVIYEASDALTGQVTFDTITVVVNDTELPLFTSCPSDTTISIPFDSTEIVYNYIAPIATENCTDFTLIRTSSLGSGDALFQRV